MAPPGIETRTDAKGETRHRAYVKAGGQKVRGPWRGNIAEARADRTVLKARDRAGIPLRKTPSGPTVEDAWREYRRLAEQGHVWTRSGGRYAPKTLRGYSQVMRDHVLPELGAEPVRELRRSRVQALVDTIAADYSGQTARNAVTPVMALYRHLLARHDDILDPTQGLDLPRGSRPRDRVATPTEMAALVGALPATDRAILALAGLAGLRRGEIRALALEDVDLDDDMLVVGFGWDQVEGRRPLKHREEGDHREVPIMPALRPYVDAALANRDGEPGSTLVVPGTGRWGDADGPFSPEAFLTRSRAAWGWERDESGAWVPQTDDDGEPVATLEPVGLHEARHSFASWLVLGGWDVATISEWLGHRHVSTTLDRYVKPMRRRGVKPADVHDYLGAHP